MDCVTKHCALSHINGCKVSCNKVRIQFAWTFTSGAVGNLVDSVGITRTQKHHMGRMGCFPFVLFSTAFSHCKSRIYQLP